MVTHNNYINLPNEDRKRLDELFERQTMTAEEAVAELGKETKIELFRLRKEKLKSQTKL